MGGEGEERAKVSMLGAEVGGQGKKVDKGGEAIA